MTIETRQQVWKDIYGNASDKAAELAGSYDMPHAASPNKKSGKFKTAEEKFAMSLVDEPYADEEEREQELQLRPTVDVAGKRPAAAVQVKKASRFALPSVGKYPLDSYEEVKLASGYFDEWHGRMSPTMKREYCQNLVKRASELGIGVSALAARYGSDSYASDYELQAALDLRKNALLDLESHALIDKLAEQKSQLDPELFAATLGAFDELTGLDQFYGSIPDPYASTFGKTAEKQEQESETSPADAYLLGNEYLPKQKLVLFAKMKNEDVRRRFGFDFAAEFANDPTSIFESLPRDQKLVIMRLANALHSASSGGASTS